MTSQNKAVLLLARIITDLLMVSLAWIVAYYLRFSAGFGAPKGIPEELLYFKLIPFIAVIWFFVFSLEGFYRRSLKKRSAFLEGLDVIQCCAMATLGFIAFTYFYEEYRYSRVVLVIFAGLHPWLIISGRSLIRKAVRYYRKHKPGRSVLIIGSERLIEQAYSLLRLSDFERLEVIGAILVGDETQIALGASVCDNLKIPIITRPDDWSTFFSENDVQTVVFAVPNKAYAFIEDNLEKIIDQVPDVKMVPDLLRYTRFASGIENIGGVPVINVHESPLSGYGSVLKRLVDILGSFTALLVFSPLMIVIGFLVKLTSPGPVFYRQQRMGLDGRTFDCLKFRSMPVDAEKTTGAIWATENDARPTDLGRFLRKTSLDELPQLINVFKGEMSIVGPRPERPVFVRDFRKNVPGYMLRHKVKAGITGWAQVNGWRGNTSIEKRIECDLYYVQNWSLWLDLKIMALTATEVFRGKNAY